MPEEGGSAVAPGPPLYLPWDCGVHECLVAWLPPPQCPWGCGLRCLPGWSCGRTHPTAVAPVPMSQWGLLAPRGSRGACAGKILSASPGIVVPEPPLWAASPSLLKSLLDENNLWVPRPRDGLFLLDDQGTPPAARPWRHPLAPHPWTLLALDRGTSGSLGARAPATCFPLWPCPVLL